VLERCPGEESERTALCQKHAAAIQIAVELEEKKCGPYFDAVLKSRSAQEAGERDGVINPHKLRIALDTSNMLGAGAVKDTYNSTRDCDGC